MRRLLMISAAFPPIGGPGVQRSLKFAKYLPRFGWEPVVWCLDSMKGLPRDETLLAELSPGTRRLVARDLISKANRHRPRAAQGWHGEQERGVSDFPDEFIQFAEASFHPLIELIRRRPIDLIYSTFSPPTNHWLGLKLKQETSVPWVADFRDLWIDDCRYSEPSAQIHARRVELQQKILESADAVVGVSPSQSAILAGHIPAKRHKVHTITNGFDSEDFLSVPARRRRNTKRFVVAHVGRFDRARVGDGLREGIAQFVKLLGTRSDSSDLRIVGHIAPQTLTEWRRAGVAVTSIPYVSHAEAIAEMRAADVLLLPLPEGRNAQTIIAAKLFEYLAARKPILVVGPASNECERIVSAARVGYSVPHSASEVAHALSMLQIEWVRGVPFCGCDDAFLSQYSRVHLTGQLANLFDTLISPTPPNLNSFASHVEQDFAWTPAPAGVVPA